MTEDMIEGEVMPLAERPEEQAAELATTRDAAAVQAEIQAAIIVARRFPRNEDVAYQRLLRACKRPKFAERARYAFPRGNTIVSGPSTYLATEVAKYWGNIKHDWEVIRDDDEQRVIRARAWDMETNTQVSATVCFNKLIQRKVGKPPNQKTIWVKPDERDLLELTNRNASKAVRNCILKLIPQDVIDDALDVAQQTRASAASQDPDSARKKIITAFDGLNITPAMLEEYLGHPVAQASPSEISELRDIYAAIREGEAKWSDFVSPPEPEQAVKGTIDVDALKPGGENRGHGQEAFEQAVAAKRKRGRPKKKQDAEPPANVAHEPRPDSGDPPPASFFEEVE